MLPSIPIRNKIYCLRKQGNKIEGVVLDRECILGFFCPEQGQRFKPSAAHISKKNYWSSTPLPPGDVTISQEDSTFLALQIYLTLEEPQY